jgi:hypothetical protein
LETIFEELDDDSSSVFLTTFLSCCPFENAADDDDDDVRGGIVDTSILASADGHAVAVDMALGESIEKKSTKNSILTKNSISTKNYEDCDLSSSRLFNA